MPMPPVQALEGTGTYQVTISAFHQTWYDYAYVNGEDSLLKYNRPSLLLHR
jgi:hypothetical protein